MPWKTKQGRGNSRGAPHHGQERKDNTDSMASCSDAVTPRVSLSTEPPVSASTTITVVFASWLSHLPSTVVADYELVERRVVVSDSKATSTPLPEGEPGELIDRLISLLDEAPDADPQWWANLGIIVAIAVGEIARLPRDPDDPPKPGTIGAIKAEQHGTASRDEYTGLIRERLGALVRQGLSEAFLVRGLRDELHRWVAHMAQTEGVDERRAQMRERLREDAEDPGAIAEVRNRTAEHEPEAVGLSDEDIRQRLLDMAARDHFDPLSPEDVVDKWAQMEHLERRCEELLPDSFIDDWTMRHALRNYGQ